MSFKQLANHSQLELLPNKIKQNYLKERDLAPLSWLSNFCLGILTNLTLIEYPCMYDSDKSNVNELFLSSKHSSRRPLLTTVV